METYTPQEMFAIAKIQEMLDRSDIVWPKYGTDNTHDLAIAIFKLARAAVRSSYHASIS